MNVLFSLVERDPQLLERVLETADNPFLAGRDWPQPGVFAQVVDERLWRGAVDGLVRPDAGFGIAEAEGHAGTWREARLIPGQDRRLLLPNDSSHFPLIAWFAPAVANRVVGGEIVQVQVVLFVAEDLDPKFDADEEAEQLRDGWLGRTFRKIRRQTRVMDRRPGRGCVSDHCDGTCRAYVVSDGAVDREICTCI